MGNHGRTSRETLLLKYVYCNQGANNINISLLKIVAIKSFFSIEYYF